MINKLLVLYILISGITSAGTSYADEKEPYYGFTAFPYAASLEAINNVNNIIKDNASLYAIHLDDCIPWEESLNGSPLPDWLQEQIKKAHSNIQPNQKVYLAFAPADFSRRNLAKQCGATEQKKGKIPDALKGKDFNYALLITAYTNYILKVINIIKPDYLNIGIEMSEIAKLEPARWGNYEKFYKKTFNILKNKHPDIEIGMSFILPSLVTPHVAKLAKPIIEMSDYVGISFYPYTATKEDYDTSYTQNSISGNGQWREPLKWLRSYTNKPIAIAETGYLSKNLYYNPIKTTFKGSQQLQTDYLEDLISFAKIDNYKFMVWFFTVDYDSIFESHLYKTPWASMWIYTGLLDKDLNKKQAWHTWQSLKNNNIEINDVYDIYTKKEQKQLIAQHTTTKIAVDLKQNSFKCNEGEFSVKANNIYTWAYPYSKEWLYCYKKTKANRYENTRSISLKIKSDRTGSVILRLDEEGGESFISYMWPSEAWQNKTINFDDLTIDIESKQNGIFEPEKLEKIMLVDSNGFSNLTGQRLVHISDMYFQ